MQGVMKTASEAIGCKVSAGYAGNGEKGESKGRKTPLLNRLYSNRSALMHKLVSASLSHSPNTGPSQLLILGAGLDSSYDKYATKVYLVDYKEVLNERASADHVRKVVGDLSDAASTLQSLLAAGLLPCAPTVVLMECVLAYIPSAAASQLLTVLATHLSNSVFVLYDPVLAYSSPSSDRFACQMHRKFAEREAPLLSCSKSHTELTERLYAAGYSHVVSCTVNQALQMYLSPEARRASTAEAFDEFASLALLQSCYAVSLATRNTAWMGALMESFAVQQSASGVTDRMAALNTRMALAELRLHCLENRKQPTEMSALSPAKVTICRGSAEDAAALVGIYEQAFGMYAERYRSVQKYIKYSVKALKSLDKTYAPESGSALLVAKDAQGRHLGCLGVKIKAPRGDEAKGTVELSHFCVDGAHQRRGVGGALLSQAIELARGSSSSICLTVLKDLANARAAYEKAGFGVVKTENLGDDCELVFMTKSIEE